MSLPRRRAWPNWIEREANAISFVLAAAIILLAVWSHRITTNAHNRGVPFLRPGLAAGGWFIPLAQVVVPFVQIRRAANSFLGNTTSVTVWQVCIATAALVSRFGFSDLEDASTPVEFSHALTGRVAFLVTSMVLFGVGLLFAKAAIREIDRRVSIVAA